MTLAPVHILVTTEVPAPTGNDVETICVVETFEAETSGAAMADALLLVASNGLDVGNVVGLRVVPSNRKPKLLRHETYLPGGMAALTTRVRAIQCPFPAEYITLMARGILWMKANPGQALPDDLKMPATAQQTLSTLDSDQKRMVNQMILERVTELNPA
jgi:hypothetical protein